MALAQARRISKTELCHLFLGRGGGDVDRGPPRFKHWTETGKFVMDSIIGTELRLAF